MVPLLLVGKETFWPVLVDDEVLEPVSQAAKRSMSTQAIAKR
jgi:hypothetical protein